MTSNTDTSADWHLDFFTVFLNKPQYINQEKNRLMYI
jgi:hypothetical protein